MDNSAQSEISHYRFLVKDTSISTLKLIITQIFFIIIVCEIQFVRLRIYSITMLFLDASEFHTYPNEGLACGLQPFQ